MANPLDRPPGLAPKGTSMGLALMSVFAPGIPAFTAMSVGPWLPGDGETGLALAFACIGVWAVICVPLILGFKLRRHWGVVLYFYVGAFCVVALPVALAILAILIVSTTHDRPPTFFYMWFGAGLIPMVPFWPFLIRALRLKYWQPWTRPDEWETGDERIAGWVFDAAGVPRRPDQAKGATSIKKPAGSKPARRRTR